MMKDEDFKLLRGFDLLRTDRQSDRRTDICDCRVAFATENYGWFGMIFEIIRLILLIFHSTPACY